jgi:hypothetical protein
MQRILNEEEFQELNNRPTAKWVEEVEEAAAKFIVESGGCRSKKGGYCDGCPLEAFPSHPTKGGPMSFPGYCIAGHYQNFSK